MTNVDFLFCTTTPIASNLLSYVPIEYLKIERT